MEKQEILRHVDHTLLKAVSDWPGICKLCDEALRYHTASVCVPPSYVARIAEKYGDALNICTVIGFPLGYCTTAVKVFEARQAVADGACEIDMVINLGDIKNGDFDKVYREISQIREAVGDKILKVIVETCYLTEDEKIRLCEIVTRAKADFIKTSTGFGTAGATREDVALFKSHVGAQVRIKAAGGIRSVQDMEDYLSLGCDRLGTSSAVSILEK